MGSLEPVAQKRPGHDGRAYRYAARTFGEVPPLEALQHLFVVRGVMTFFGHPLFTAMIGNTALQVCRTP